MVLGFFVSGIISLHNGHGCDQRDERSLTMVLDSIYVACGRIWNEATILAADKIRR